MMSAREKNELRARRTAEVLAHGFPAWVVDGDTGKKTRYVSYDEAMKAGLRRYRTLKASGKYAEDSYAVLHQGVTYSVTE
jgi:hypothetical protein